MNFRIFSSDTYLNRRTVLRHGLESGLIVLLGNQEAPMNYKDNTYHFRQDSTFLYYFGLDVPGLSAVIDVDAGHECIFGTDLSIDDIVWTGPQPSVNDMAQSVGVHSTQDYNHIESIIKKALKSGRKIHYLPPYRHDNIIRLAQWLDISTEEVMLQPSLPLIKKVISQRSIKEDCEITEIDHAVNITTDMHLAAMQHAKPGLKEYELVSLVHQEAIKGGGNLAFPIILTTDGQTLHNHYHGNTLRDGQMILCDAGAENDMHYAGDMTCTFPVGPAFTSRQKDIYQIVLDTHTKAVEMLQPGIQYRDIYLQACRNIFNGLKSLHLTKGDADEAVAAGAHAMFFQCGLGHMMGLDVHDMEDLGEQYVGYTPTLRKSTQFGIKSLRLARELQSGFVLTVEPGIYFIPTLIDMWRAEGRCRDFINYEVLEKYKDFSGIRVEEDFLITQDGYRLLGRSLPKTIEEIEDLRRK